LRSINNNPGVFGKNRKPIVEFALEDHRMLRIRELKSKRANEVPRPAQREKSCKVGRGKRQRLKKKEAAEVVQEEEKTQKVQKKPKEPKEPVLRQKRSRAEEDIDVEVMDFESPSKGAVKKRKKLKTEDSLDKLVEAYRKKLEKKLSIGRNS
jgi:nucleolar protein 4